MTWLLSLCFAVAAETVFEGFYRIERDQKHVGFVVQRLRKDGDLRILTSYLRVRNADDSETAESFRTAARPNGQPVASEHHGDVAGVPPLISRFVGARGWVTLGANALRRPAAIGGTDFFGSFLFFLSDLARFTPERVYRYQAFAEERGRAEVGNVRLIETMNVGGTKIYRLLDDYLGTPTESFVAGNGQPLGSRSIRGNTLCYWVPSRADAVGELGYPNREVIALFGDLPVGAKNVWRGVKDLGAADVIRGAARWRGRRILTYRDFTDTATLPRRTL